MRIKVELHPEVVWYLKSRCNAEEVDGFYRQLARVRAAPISNSEAIAKPRRSRYILRFFRFGSNIAVFGFSRSRDTIKVCECCKRLPRRSPSDAEDVP